MTCKVPAFLFVLSISGCISQVALRKCGIKPPPIGGLIMNGTSAAVGQFPWLGVWCYGNTTADCFCSVNLITKQHAVTAAHCLYPKKVSFPTYWPNTTIHFGRNNLTDDKEEEQSQVRKIIDAMMHENWSTKTDEYNSDIAVLRFDKPVEFNTNVQPVCLPKAADFVAGSENGSIVSIVSINCFTRSLNLNH